LQVCQELKLCQADVVEPNELIRPETDDRPYCALCEYAIGEVDQMIENKKNEDEIKQALDRICYLLR